MADRRAEAQWNKYQYSFLICASPMRCLTRTGMKSTQHNIFRDVMK